MKFQEILTLHRIFTELISQRCSATPTDEPVPFSKLLTFLNTRKGHQLDTLSLDKIHISSTQSVRVSFLKLLPEKSIDHACGEVLVNSVQKFFHSNIASTIWHHLMIKQPRWIYISSERLLLISRLYHH